jgi:hypothetical protein
MLPVETYLSALGGELPRRQVPTTIVLDALDEGTNRVGLVEEVLEPLWRQHRRRLSLLIGVRSLGGGDVTAEEAAMEGTPLADLVAVKLRARRIPVDDKLRWSRTDFMTYICNVLRNIERSPYRDANDETVTSLAEVICDLGRYLVSVGRDGCGGSGQALGYHRPRRSRLGQRPQGRPGGRVPG